MASVMLLKTCASSSVKEPLFLFPLPVDGWPPRYPRTATLMRQSYMKMVMRWYVVWHGSHATWSLGLGFRDYPSSRLRVYYLAVWRLRARARRVNYHTMSFILCWSIRGFFLPLVFLPCLGSSSLLPSLASTSVIKFCDILKVHTCLMFACVRRLCKLIVLFSTLYWSIVCGFINLKSGVMPSVTNVGTPRCSLEPMKNLSVARPN
jgi:hypothetical protein